ncbi:unnamed protein product [Caenorhabditis sp. 36 PRJEB53466]|nr:unnamed protein product [Caenorhabditis sp. 36 PRJEB53466]
MAESLQKFYRHTLDPSMKWFPRPTEPCKKDYYTEKVELLVNWFKFASNIYDREYYEYSVEMYKVKKFKDKSGRLQEKEVNIAILDRPKLFWQHLRHDRARIEEFVFDNRDTVYSVNRVETGIESKMLSPDNQFVTYVLSLKPRQSFRLNFSRENPLNDEQADRSYKFLKAVMTQKVRYSPKETNEVALEFSKKYLYDSNIIHRVPESFYDPDSFEHSLQIAPRIELWFGIYIAVKELYTGEPVLNFAIVDKLFFNAPSMSLLDYLLLLVDPETYQDEVRNSRKQQLRDGVLTVNQRVRRKIDGYLANLKLKCSEVWDPEKRRMVERHPTYLRLHDENAYEHQVSVTAGRGRNAPILQVPLSQVYRDNRKIIEFPNLPLVVVKTGANELLAPMEFLAVHEKPQRYKNWIDMAMKFAIVKKATRKPHVYKEETIRMLQDLDFKSEELDFVQKFGLSPELKMLTCTGKVLKEPNLVNKKNDKIKMTPVVRGFQEIELNVVPEKTLCCALFIVNDPRDPEPCITENQSYAFYSELIDRCEFRGLKIEPNANKMARSILSLEEDGQKTFAYYANCAITEGSADSTNFKKAAQHAKGLYDRLPDKSQKTLLFIIISKRSLDGYGYFKWFCDVELGVASQHITHEVVLRTLQDSMIEKGSHRIGNQIALKINAKLNGVNQELDYSEMAELSPEQKEERKKMPLKMFVGIDVTHPTNGSGIDFSIASIVASIDWGGTRFRNRVVVQEECRPGERPVAHGRERTDILEGKFIGLLQTFAQNNDNRIPAHIVVYRDGVSDSEMLRVSHDELRSLRNEVTLFLAQRGAGEPEPMYTFIVVQKRHRTRFMRKMSDKRPADEEAAKRWDNEEKESAGTRILNPHSGTTVDKTVVSKYKFDFFLASHHGALGTSRPGYYTVMYDNSGITKDEVYKMTYELAFLSARVRKPISLPVPVLYAHLSCEKAKEMYKAYKKYIRHDDPTVKGRQRIEAVIQPSDAYPGMPFV